jgi:RNA polymerase sigma-70 factor (ECF subfamily)
MSDDSPFASFIRRIRAGDAGAAEELLRRYEPVIRRQVRYALTDPRLGRLFDSVDICQTVLASFFFRARLGQYDLDQPDHLLGLLITLTRRKVALKARQYRSRPADRQRVDESALQERAAAGMPSPSEEAARRDLAAEVHRRLSPEERQLATLRLDEGLAWPAIAARLGGTAEARRKQWERTVERLAGELRIDEDNDA